MLPELNGIEIAELILVAGGAVALLASAIAVTVRRGWGKRLSVDDPPPNRLEPPDLLLGFVAVFLLPALAVAFAPGSDADAASVSSQGNEVALASTAKFALAAAGQLAGIAILISIGASRFVGGIGGWGLNEKSALRRFGSSLLIYVIVWPVCSGLVYASLSIIRLRWPDFQPDEHVTIDLLLRTDTSAASRWMLMGTAVILAPLAEELFFRGLLLPILVRRLRSAWAAIVVTAVAFGAMHYAVPHHVPALMVLGTVLGYVYLRTQSLTLAILVHMVFNAKSIVWLALGAAS